MEHSSTEKLETDIEGLADMISKYKDSNSVFKSNILKEVQDNLSKLSVSETPQRGKCTETNEIIKKADEILRNCTTSDCLKDEHDSKVTKPTVTDLEQASIITDNHAENLNAIFQKIEEHQRQRKLEYEKLLTQISDSDIRKATLESENLNHLKTQITQIRSDYVAVENELKEVQNELNILRQKFEAVDDVDNDGTHCHNDLLKILEEEQKSVTPENDTSYLSSVLAEVAKLSKDSEEFENYVKTLETEFNKKVD